MLFFQVLRPVLFRFSWYAQMALVVAMGRLPIDRFATGLADSRRLTLVIVFVLQFVLQPNDMVRMRLGE